MKTKMVYAVLYQLFIVGLSWYVLRLDSNATFPLLDNALPSKTTQSMIGVFVYFILISIIAITMFSLFVQPKLGLANTVTMALAFITNIVLLNDVTPLAVALAIVFNTINYPLSLTTVNELLD